MDIYIVAICSISTVCPCFVQIFKLITYITLKIIAIISNKSDLTHDNNSQITTQSSLSLDRVSWFKSWYLY